MKLRNGAGTTDCPEMRWRLVIYSSIPKMTDFQGKLFQLQQQHSAAFNTNEPTVSQPTVRYNFRSHRIPNRQFDPSELLRQRATSEQRSLAVTWTQICKDIDRLQVYTWDHISAATSSEKLQRLCASLGVIYEQYLPGIKDIKRLETVVSVYKSLKERSARAIEEYQRLKGIKSSVCN